MRRFGVEEEVEEEGSSFLFVFGSLVSIYWTCASILSKSRYWYKDLAWKSARISPVESVEFALSLLCFSTPEKHRAKAVVAATLHLFLSFFRELKKASFVAPDTESVPPFYPLFI